MTSNFFFTATDAIKHNLWSQNTNHNPYLLSVPLSVYRELAAELQAAEAMLDSCNAQNQHLAKQNQQLRQEISKSCSVRFASTGC